MARCRYYTLPAITGFTAQPHTTNLVKSCLLKYEFRNMLQTCTFRDHNCILQVVSLRRVLQLRTYLLKYLLRSASRKLQSCVPPAVLAFPSNVTSLRFAFRPEYLLQRQVQAVIVPRLNNINAFLCAGAFIRCGSCMYYQRVRLCSRHWCMR